MCGNIDEISRSKFSAKSQSLTDFCLGSIYGP